MDTISIDIISIDIISIDIRHPTALVRENLEEYAGTSPVQSSRQPILVPRPLYARSARWERDKPVVRACVEFYWNPGKIVFFGVYFSILT